MAAPVTAAEVCRNFRLLNVLFTVHPPVNWELIALTLDLLPSGSHLLLCGEHGSP
jgi:hypothetical protein